MLQHMMDIGPGFRLIGLGVGRERAARVRLQQRHRDARVGREEVAVEEVVGDIREELVTAA